MIRMNSAQTLSRMFRGAVISQSMKMA